MPYARTTDRPYGRYDEVSYDPSLPSNRLERRLQRGRSGRPVVRLRPTMRTVRTLSLQPYELAGKKWSRVEV
jgi:hypothetical protein